MKYLKTYEDSIKDLTRKLKKEIESGNINPNDIDSLIDTINKRIRSESDMEFIPGQIYTTEENGDFCYVGDTGNENFSNLCLLFKKDYQGRFYFIVWNNWFKHVAQPLNVDIVDYIIQKNIVEDIEKSLKRISFSEEPTNKQRNMAYRLRDRIFNSKEFKIAKTSNKYNL